MLRLWYNTVSACNMCVQIYKLSAYNLYAQVYIYFFYLLYE
jgi:hypothetical protein